MRWTTCAKIVLNLNSWAIEHRLPFFANCSGALNIEWSEERVLLVKKTQHLILSFPCHEETCRWRKYYKDWPCLKQIFLTQCILSQCFFCYFPSSCTSHCGQLRCFFMEIISILIESLSIIGSCSSLVKSDTNYKTQMRENYHQCHQVLHILAFQANGLRNIKSQIFYLKSWLEGPFPWLLFSAFSKQNLALL